MCAAPGITTTCCYAIHLSIRRLATSLYIFGGSPLYSKNMEWKQNCAVAQQYRNTNYIGIKTTSHRCICSLFYIIISIVFFGESRFIMKDKGVQSKEIENYFIKRTTFFK